MWSGRSTWVSNAKDLVQATWDREYKNLDLAMENHDEPTPKRQRTQYYSPFEQYKDTARTRPSNEKHLKTKEDEYARWQRDLSLTDNDIRDPREYWHAQRFKYPRLSRMALDFMTVQAMSAECERLFSAAGRMVTPLRSQLEANTIAICQVLRSWLQAGIAEEIDPMLLKEADEATQGTDGDAVRDWLGELPSQMREEGADGG